MSLVKKMINKLPNHGCTGQYIFYSLRVLPEETLCVLIESHGVWHGVIYQQC